MIGYRPGPYIKYCWLFFTPATCIVSTNKLIKQYWDSLNLSSFRGLPEIKQNSLCSSINTHLILPQGHLRLLPHQIHSSKVQQWICVSVVGQCHWLAARTLLHGLHPTLDGLQDQYHPRDTQRGKSWPSWWSFSISNFLWTFIPNLSKPGLDLNMCKCGIHLIKTPKTAAPLTLSYLSPAHPAAHHTIWQPTQNQEGAGEVTGHLRPWGRCHHDYKWLLSCLRERLQLMRPPLVMCVGF